MYHACPYGRSGHDIVLVKEGKVETFGEASRTQLEATCTFHFYSLSFSSCQEKGEDGWNSSSHLENRMIEGLLEARYCLSY